MRAPAESQGLSPQLSDSFVNGGGLGLGLFFSFFFSGGGGQKTARVNDGGWESEGGGARKTIPPTSGHSQTQEMLDLAP